MLHLLLRIGTEASECDAKLFCAHGFSTRVQKIYRKVRATELRFIAVHAFNSKGNLFLVLLEAGLQFEATGHDSGGNSLKFMPSLQQPCRNIKARDEQRCFTIAFVYPPC